MRPSTIATAAGAMHLDAAEILAAQRRIDAGRRDRGGQVVEQIEARRRRSSHARP